MSDNENSKEPKLLQLYEWYPIPDGCPNCKGSIVGQASMQQRTGEQNIQITNCPHCNIGLELVICKEQFNPLKTKKNLVPDLDGKHMRAEISDTLVLNPTQLGSPAEA